MHDVAVERGQILVALHQGEQVGAHRHQVAGAARRAVEPADQLLPPRLGSEMKVAGVGVVRLRAPALDRPRQLFAVGAEVARQRSRRTSAGRRRRGRGNDRARRAPSRCRRLRPGPTAAPRIVQAAPRHPGGRLMAHRAEAACGRVLISSREGRRKRRWPCGGSNPMGFAESYTGFRAMPITIKHGSYGSMSCLPKESFKPSRRIPSASCR